MSRCFPLLQRREHVSSGQVCLKGTGVSVEAVVGRYSAGDAIEILMDEYRVSREAIEDAIRCVLWAAWGDRGGLPVRIERRMETFVPVEG